MKSVSVVVVLILSSVGGHAQGKADAFYAQVERFRGQAAKAYDAEMARDKAGVCREAQSTSEIVDCLAKEIEITTANYKAYTGALRSLLGIMGTDDADQVPGPTGRQLTSKELVKEFDAAETAWQAYREAQTTAAYDQFKGGTLAPVQAGTCVLMLIRSHMHEIDLVYSSSLHN